MEPTIAEIALSMPLPRDVTLRVLPDRSDEPGVTRIVLEARFAKGVAINGHAAMSAVDVRGFLRDAIVDFSERVKRVTDD